MCNFYTLTKQGRNILLKFCSIKRRRIEITLFRRPFGTVMINLSTGYPTSSTSAVQETFIDFSTLIAAGHLFWCKLKARSAASFLPLGILRAYLTRIWEMTIVPSIFSISPSTSEDNLSGKLGIPRASSTPANVPVSQPPTAAIM